MELGGKTYTYTSLLTLVEYAVPGLLQSKPEFGDNLERKTKEMKIRESDSLTAELYCWSKSHCVRRKRENECGQKMTNIEDGMMRPVGELLSIFLSPFGSS